MSDTNTLRSRIASELNYGLTDAFGNSGETFATVVNREINAAIRHYETTRFRWNEVREFEFATTVSGTRTVSLPANLIRMDTLKLIYSGAYVELSKRTSEEIERKDTDVSGTTGIPSIYAIHGNMVRLYVTPGGAYTLAASYIRRFLPTSLTGSYTAQIRTAGTYSLTVTTTASHNARADGWTTDGMELVMARAKAAVEINYLKRPEAQAEARGMAMTRQPFLSTREAQAFERLNDEMVDMSTSGYIKPYCI
jgi:hypothetical protein